MPLIRLSNVHKSYPDEAWDVPVLLGVDLTVDRGELAVIMGPSGSGKTTLLNLLAGIDRPDSGSFLVDGADLASMNEGELTVYRREKVGYVFQFYNLIPNLTALENVELALQIKGERNLSRARKTLGRVGLGDKVNRFPAKLSGGEQQRVALARALVKKPLLVLADEPTGNLDEVTSGEIMEQMRELNARSGITFIVATHDRAYEEIASRTLHLKEGTLAPER